MEILLLASISFELPVEADTTIWSVVYLICDLVDEDFSLTVSDKLIDKFTDKIMDPIMKLNEFITIVKGFVNATSKTGHRAYCSTGVS